ncbi:MAG: Fe-S cluster assembly protein SufD [Bacteroidales bacterium]|nr:Fe-S cluster assembly protein SufD [Bacteroidales bacterium]
MPTIIEQLRDLPTHIKRRDSALHMQDDISLTGFAKAARKNNKDIKETWRDFDLTPYLDGELVTPQREEQAPHVNVACNIPLLEATHLAAVNGFCYEPLRRLKNGIVMGGLREAMLQCPELVDCYLGQAIKRGNPYQQLNAQHFSDGLFVFVPNGVAEEQPIQLQAIANNPQDMLMLTRNLIVVGDGAQVSFIHCDDSATPRRSVASNVTELIIGASSNVQYYKMQNLNNDSALLNQCFVWMQHDTKLLSNAITFNGGHIRNHTEIRMAGEQGHAEAHGLYLIDKNQRAENYVYVEHNAPNCVSHELFKGIVDDSAHAGFSGHVLVCEGATKTEAYMSNKNILLTDKATISTHPFLEIYNDDVKCSHGTTTGQVNEEEMFYLRSRGIGERTARTLLLYAFCDELVQKIEHPTLKEAVGDMVKKRLHGELTPCSECAIPCSSPCNGPAANFRIDRNKL